MTQEYPVVLHDLPGSVRGFVCLGSDYEPVIILNSNLSREELRRVYRHEVDHIRSGQMFDDDYREYQ